MRHKGVWLALLAVMVMTTTVSAKTLAEFSGMIHVPSGEEMKDPHGMRYYSIPPDGGTHTLEIGAWYNRFNSYAVFDGLVAATAGPVTVVAGRPISRVEFKVYNLRTGEVLQEFDGSVEEFLSLGTLLPGDYETPSAFKFHMDICFPAGVDCWYAELVIWAGDSRAGHADMRIYAGGYHRFVDTYGMWY